MELQITGFVNFFPKCLCSPLENIWNNKTIILTILTTNTCLFHHSQDITLSVCFFHVSKIATLTQINAVYSQPHFLMSISVSQPVRNIGIAVFSGRAVFAHLRCLNFILVPAYLFICLLINFFVCFPFPHLFSCCVSLPLPSLCITTLYVIYHIG